MGVRLAVHGARTSRGRRRSALILKSLISDIVLRRTGAARGDHRARLLRRRRTPRPPSRPAATRASGGRRAVPADLRPCRTGSASSPTRSRHRHRRDGPRCTTWAAAPRRHRHRTGRPAHPRCWPSTATISSAAPTGTNGSLYLSQQFTEHPDAEDRSATRRLTGPGAGRRTPTRTVRRGVDVASSPTTYNGR